MSFHFQQLHADVFEDRAMPSVSFLTIPAGYFGSASVRIADQGLLSTPRAFNQATAMRFSDQGFALVPVWANANGGATFLIVNLRNAPSAEQGITLGPVSQRLSSGATADAPEAAEQTVQQTVQEATPRTPQANPTTTPASYNPEQAARAVTLPNAPRQQEAATRTVEQATPAVFTSNTSNAPLLRDYSTSAVSDETPRVPLPDERVPTPETVEPPVAPRVTTTPSEPSALTVDELSVTPLAGMLPFNVADLEKETSNLLQRVANFGEDVVEEISASSEYVWLTAAAVVAGGAAIAARSTRPLKPVYATNGPLAAWKDKHDGQRG